jgi:hypothetical protein
MLAEILCKWTSLDSFAVLKLSIQNHCHSKSAKHLDSLHLIIIILTDIYMHTHTHTHTHTHITPNKLQDVGCPRCQAVQS